MGYSPNDDIETISIHIRQLRTKIEKANPEKHIETIYGGGYRLIPEGIAKSAKA
ncbi:MAG: winged helix-turn-helix domain-containing protein [Bacillus subtilis]|nr:winged helix-turn-helix domain-containing protein [Bacillus subtilis]